MTDQIVKKTILFVDDEEGILTALKRMLRAYRNKWNMEFVDSAEKALMFLENQPECDVIVSDIRMPKMDGVELLNKVKQVYPSVIRIILSGHSDYKSALLSTCVAHQYLAKPCDAETLKKAIEQTATLQAVLNSQKIQKIVAEDNTLPTPPQLYFDVMKEIDSPNGTMESISYLVEQDIAMTAKVLQLVNSAFFGLPR